MQQSKNESAKILIVDDLEVNVGILESIIESEGYEPLCALSVKEALEIMNKTMPQLILSDYYMPEVNGLEFCRMLKQNPRTRDIPFMLITVADSSEDKREAFEAGAVDYIPKPFERVEVIMRVNNQINNYRAKQEIAENNRMMHQIITEQKIQVEREQRNLLSALAKVLEKRYRDRGDSLACISHNSRMLAQCLQLTEEYEQEINDEFAELIQTASKLQNLGALVLDGSLSRTETGESSAYTERHTEEGAAVLEEISEGGAMSYALSMAYDIAKYHHAHWDGSGHPGHLSGTNIPLAARIVKLVSDYDRELRQARTEQEEEKVLETIAEKSGKVYEPFLVEVFLKIKKQLKKPS